MKIKNFSLRLNVFLLIHTTIKVTSRRYNKLSHSLQVVAMKAEFNSVIHLSGLNVITVVFLFLNNIKLCYSVFNLLDKDADSPGMPLRLTRELLNTLH